MLEDGVGLLSGRWGLVEGWSAFFGFVDHAETGNVAAEGRDRVIWIEGVGDGCVVSGGWIGGYRAVGVEVEVGELGSG